MNLDYLLHPSRILILAVIAGVLSGALTSMAVLNSQPSQDKLMKDFYMTENAVHVSPHSLRGKMTKGVNDYILVDLRSQEEYETEHIAGAISIPAYKDKDTSDYGSVDRIVGAFAKLPKDKDIIVYCYSIPCMTGRKIGLMLAEHGIYVKLLGIGWNEWRYFWDLWNHEHEWNVTDGMDYIATGSEPGAPKIDSGSNACPLNGEFGC